MSWRVCGSIAFAAIVLTGMALVAPAAHLLELPNKMRMEANDYFVVQRVYNGWWLVGLLLPAALVANLALAVAARYDGMARILAMLAAALIALDLAIFFVWTQPANAATANWTTEPEAWLDLRRQWEYSHAINAGIMFLAFCATTAASLRGEARRRPRPNSARPKASGSPINRPRK
jgi:hypothetical protein